MGEREKHEAILAVTLVGSQFCPPLVSKRQINPSWASRRLLANKCNLMFNFQRVGFSALLAMIAVTGWGGKMPRFHLPILARDSACLVVRCCKDAVGCFHSHHFVLASCWKAGSKSVVNLWPEGYFRGSSMFTVISS